MKAKEYEYLLSKIYYDGVLKMTGLNIEMYLKMQQEYDNLKAFEAKNNTVECNYAFRKSFFIVRNYVQQAIKDGLRSYQVDMGAKDAEKLSQMVAVLNRDFFDKKGLDHIIATANLVFKQYNLKN